MSSTEEINSTKSDTSNEEEEYDYPKPTDIVLPNFLNTDMKWNEVVYETDNLTKYKDIIIKIYSLAITKEHKRKLLIKLTQDIVDAQRYLSPHWHLLYSSDLFN